MSGIARLPGRVNVFADGVAVSEAAADWLIDLSQSRIADTGVFSIALAGGSTPRQLYQALAAEPRRSRVDWGRWTVYFGDERACPPNDPNSNFRLAEENLLRRVPIFTESIHRIEAERPDLDAAAALYSSLLARTQGRGPDGAPRLDCVLLGLGEDGHTASLFPGTAALEVRDRWATRGRAAREPFDRITLTFPVINAARQIAFLITGDGKGDALRGIPQGTVPAAGVQPLDGELRWFLDTAATDSIEAR